MLVVLSIFGSIALFILLLLTIDRTYNHDVVEVNGEKVYGDMPAYRWCFVAVFGTAMISGIAFVAFYFSSKEFGNSKFPLLVLQMIVLGLHIYSYGFKGRSNKVAFKTDVVEIHLYGSSTAIKYYDLRDVYIPRFWSWKRIINQPEGPQFKDQDGNAYEISTARIGLGLKARFIQAEFRRRLEAAGVPYTT
jgi:hypothetical protein